MGFFAATQPLRPALKSLLLNVLVLIEVEQSSRSLCKSLEDALRLDKNNRTKVLSSLADVALGLPEIFACLQLFLSLLSFLKCSALNQGYTRML